MAANSNRFVTSVSRKEYRFSWGIVGPPLKKSYLLEVGGGPTRLPLLHGFIHPYHCNNALLFRIWIFRHEVIVANSTHNPSCLNLSDRFQRSPEILSLSEKVDVLFGNGFPIASAKRTNIVAVCSLVKLELG